MQRLIGLLTLLLGLSVCASAQAQSGSMIIDRSRPDRAPAATVAAPPAPVAAGNVRPDAPAVEAFVFQRLDVAGSTLSPDLFTKMAAPFIGKTISRQDVIALSQHVGAVYAKSNIALYTVLVPQQTFANGVVRVRVIEGYVRGVDVKDQPGRPKSDLSRLYAEVLNNEKPLERSSLERQLGLIRDIPGAQPDIQILQGDAPGAVRLAVTPKIRRFEATASVNSRGASMLGRTQVELGVHANSLLREGDRTDLTVAFPTDIEKFQYIGLGHSEKIGSLGTSVSANVGYLRTKPDLGGGVKLTGTAKTAGVTVVHPVIRSNQKNLYVTGGLDGLDSDNALFGRQISQERTRALRVAATYTAQSATKVLSANATVSKGLDALGARMANPVLSEADFTKLSAQLTRAVYTEKTALRLAAAGQITGDRLPASEKFAVGGAQFGRAFASSVISGDSGFAVSAEFALRQPTGKMLAGSEAYVFADYGQVSQTSSRSPFPDDAVSSAGAGLRFAVTKRGVVEVEAAKALNDVAGRGGTRATRLMLNVRSSF